MGKGARVRGTAIGLGAVLMTAGGCAAPVLLMSAGAGLNLASLGTVAYIRGELQAAWRVPLEQTHAATLAALGTLELPPTVDKFKSKSAYIAMEDATGREISIRLEAISPAVTKIMIRVGFLGDQAVSTLILRQIDHELPGDSPFDPAPAIKAAEPPAGLPESR